MADFWSITVTPNYRIIFRLKAETFTTWITSIIIEKEPAMKRNLAPVHPGEILREEYIQERGLTITEVAKGLGIARANLSAIVNERAGVLAQN